MRVVYGPLGTAPSLLRRTTALSCPPFGARRCLAARDVGAGESSPRRFRKIAVAAGVLWVWRIAKRPVGGLRLEAARGSAGQGPVAFLLSFFRSAFCVICCCMCVCECVCVCLSVWVSLFFFSFSLKFSYFLNPCHKYYPYRLHETDM